jgi:sulfite reductase alpha subunit-like flavoprotein
LITKKNADLYVCGRKSLADGVFKVLTEILNKNGKNGNEFIESMKVCF